MNIHNKHILVLASARSGSHALCSHLSVNYHRHNMGEICRQDGVTDIDRDLSKFLDQPQSSVASLVQMDSKVRLSARVSEIKKNCTIVQLRRRDKVKQFASWIYFHRSGSVFRSWHNHRPEQMYIEPGTVEVTSQDIDQFLLEQIIDDFFAPDQVLYYEDLDFSKSQIRKNVYAWDLPNMFSNLDFVKANLADWKYHE